MRRINQFLAAVAATALGGVAVVGEAMAGEIHRDRATGRAFQHEHPCPATGRRDGGCPGWVRDHVVPLCAGGADVKANMQWQTATEARIKDRDELALCRALREIGPQESSRNATGDKIPDAPGNKAAG